MFRFTIRDLLWLTVVTAFASLWWAEYRQRMNENALIREETAQLRSEQERLKAWIKTTRAAQERASRINTIQLDQSPSQTTR
jgi:hypothetical protein